ncbi:uncharacterized protein LOC120355064 [Nilaparvata lugens]|uniref:uncharacterized protein LOC120355064 n=1 Tax=Nilaparvata lugens TaxID=108931 RepID=UPI00193D35AE|nr:uncharacterized protein LOC120355064 [Nilaparvata lugens]
MSEEICNQEKSNVEILNKIKQRQRRNAKYSCPSEDCPEEFATHCKFIEHLEKEHSFQSEVDELTFNSEDDFLNWKNELRKKFLVDYIKETSAKKVWGGAKKVYLHCHRLERTNQKLKNAETRKRALKSQGLKKTCRSCPSRIEVIYKKNSTVSVIHWKDHLGHNNELSHCPLDKSTKEYIAKRLREGDSFDIIMDEIRSKGFYDDPRALFLKRKDLHNVVRGYKLAGQTKTIREEYGMNAKLWVNEMAELGEDSPVIFYHQQGDDHPNLDTNDFVLILMTHFQANQILKLGTRKIFIDVIRGTNGYFNLTTLLTVDEFGAGCPAAYCLSNKLDENQITLFFEKIKEKVGTVSCNAFMSDDASAFYNCWCRVMGPPDHKLLCPWYVLKCWRNNLSKVKGEPLKKSLVHKYLKILMHTLSEDQFQNLLAQTLANLINDPETEEFGEYFLQYYASRPGQWAFCFRTGLAMDNNTYLESFHRTLKQEYLEGIKVKRLDKTLNTIMKMARDGLFTRLSNLSKHSLSTRVRQINESHTASEAIAPSDFTVIKEGEEWVVASSNGIESYVINKSQTICEDACVKCALCSICIHSFKCTCTDNIIKMNICKHIHACCTVFNLTNSSDSCDLEDLDINPLSEPTNDNMENTVNLALKARAILDLLSEAHLSDVNSSLVESKLDGAISLLNMAHSIQDTNLESDNRQNENNKIKPRVIVLSVKENANNQQFELSQKSNL